MAKKKLLSDATTRQVIVAAALLVLGILFCVSVAALDIVNIIIGVGFIVAGGVLLVAELVKNKSISTSIGLFGGILVAFGVAIIVLNWLGALATLVVIALMVLGALYVVDSVLLIAWRDKKNWKGFAIEFAIGAVAFTVGMCLWFVPEFGEFANLVFGIILILYGLYLLVDAFLKKK